MGRAPNPARSPKQRLWTLILCFPKSRCPLRVHLPSSSMLTLWFPSVQPRTLSSTARATSSASSARTACASAWCGSATAWMTAVITRTKQTVVSSTSRSLVTPFEFRGPENRLLLLRIPTHACVHHPTCTLQSILNIHRCHLPLTAGRLTGAH